MLLVAEPNLGEEEKAALAEVVDSGWITMGGRVRALEETFAREHQVSDAVAVNSCTAGLHLVMQALGIGPGDEVLVPSLTFVATINSVIYVGATPVFLDIESMDVPLVSYADAVAKCTVRTKAVIVMHYGGYLVDRHAWREFAESRGLFLVEDAAHAVGMPCADMVADAAVFSFFGNKNMTTAEGGMIVARSEEMLDRLRKMRSHGMTSGTLQRLDGASYDVTALGYNYRMDEFRAAIGLAQIRKLRRWNEQRRALTQAYRRSLGASCPSVSVPFSTDRPSSHHILPVVLPKGVDRQGVATQMRDAGIQTSLHYPPAHRFSWHRTRFPGIRLPQTEEFALRELTLPLHPKLEDSQVESVTLALARALA